MTVPTKTEARISCFRAKIKPGYLIRIIRAVLVGSAQIRLGVRALSFMVQYQLKLKLTPRQERQLNHWLWHLAAVWNARRRVSNGDYVLINSRQRTQEQPQAMTQQQDWNAEREAIRARVETDLTDEIIERTERLLK